jgi:hypothetical protein
MALHWGGRIETIRRGGLFGPLRITEPQSDRNERDLLPRVEN